MGAQLVLERRPAGPGSCSWCGQARQRLYAYGFGWGAFREDFCNVQCASSFYDWPVGRNRPYDYIHTVRET